MRSVEPVNLDYQAPALLQAANQLASYLKTLRPVQLEKHMHLSKTKAVQTHSLLETWTDEPSLQRPALDAFLGDIYSGLQVQSFTSADRDFANDHLLILSGLYGGLRALDSIHPYRLEMGYKLPKTTYKSLYGYWNDSIARLIPNESDIVNLSAVEYTKAVLPYTKGSAVISPKFLTVSPKTGAPTFVTVHAKIARGAFAGWMIRNRIDRLEQLTAFNGLGYRYSKELSSPEEPVFVCQSFEGLGLSVRLS